MNILPGLRMCWIIGCMGTRGTRKQVAKRRSWALAMLERGMSTAEVAAKLGVSARSVRLWRQLAQHPRPEANTLPLSRRSKLTAESMEYLEERLEGGVYAYGYVEDYWTLDWIAQVIWQCFEVRYHPSSEWHVLQLMGWSNHIAPMFFREKPQQRSIQREAEAIEQWKPDVLREIIKVADPSRKPRVRR